MSESTQPQQESPIHVDLEVVENWKSVAHVRVQPEHLEKMREKVARKLAAKVRMDGFRPGKVPVAVVRKQMPGAVEQDALEALIPEVYRQVLNEHADLHPIADPYVDNLELPENEPLTFDLIIETRPDLEIQGIEAVEATRVLPPVTDERVEEALESLRQRHAHWHARTDGGVQEGDAVLIDSVPLDAENQPLADKAEEDQALLVGGDGMLPEITAALVGMLPHEETDVEVNYPVDYPNEELRGTIHKVRLRVKEVRTKHLHEFDDEFAQHHSRFATIGEMREDVRVQLTRNIRNESNRHLRQQLVDRLLAINPVPVPPSLERRYLEAILNDMLRNQPQAQEFTEEQKAKLQEAYRPVAQQAVQRMILVDNLRRSLEIEVSDAELDARIAELAEEQGTTVERLRPMLERTRNLERVRGEIEEDRIFEHLESKARITVTEEVPEAPEQPGVA
jgi:trigger factor